MDPIVVAAAVGATAALLGGMLPKLLDVWIEARRQREAWAREDSEQLRDRLFDPEVGYQEFEEWLHATEFKLRSLDSHNVSPRPSLRIDYGGPHGVGRFLYRFRRWLSRKVTRLGTRLFGSQ